MSNSLEVLYQSEHADDPVLISDEDGVDRLIDQLLSSPSSHSMAQVYSTARARLSSGMFDHELMVGVDGERRVGLLAFMDGEAGNIVTFDGSNESGIVMYHLAGHSTEYPGGTEIPIDYIRRGVKEFLSSGGRIPTCVQWKPEAW